MNTCLKLIALTVALLFTPAAAAQTPSTTQDDTHSPRPMADLILVDKSAHVLTVMSRGKIVAKFYAGFGLDPVGHKKRQGDRKTPEGKYVLDYKNPNSSYYRSIHISYPNAADRAQAHRGGYSPGGDVMIHGQPNDPRVRASIRRWPSPDWTDGCISLSDEDMKILWEMVRVPVPIEIVP